MPLPAVLPSTLHLPINHSWSPSSRLRTPTHSLLPRLHLPHPPPVLATPTSCPHVGTPRHPDQPLRGRPAAHGRSCHPAPTTPPGSTRLCRRPLASHLGRQGEEPTHPTRVLLPILPFNSITLPFTPTRPPLTNTTSPFPKAQLPPSSSSPNTPARL